MVPRVQKAKSFSGFLNFHRIRFKRPDVSTPGAYIGEWWNGIHTVRAGFSIRRGGGRKVSPSRFESWLPDKLQGVACPHQQASEGSAVFFETVKSRAPRFHKKPPARTGD